MIEYLSKALLQKLVNGCLGFVYNDGTCRKNNHQKIVSLQALHTSSYESLGDHDLKTNPSFPSPQDKPVTGYRHAQKLTPQLSDLLINKLQMQADQVFFQDNFFVQPDPTC